MDERTHRASVRELLWFAHTMLGILVNERERDKEGNTDHGCPSGGIKSAFSTTIEP